MMDNSIQTLSSLETCRLGEILGKNLSGSEIICLHGELGTGKTVLAKGLGKGLGVREEITSPTFTLIQEYGTSRGFRFVHMDLYRLRDIGEAEAVGIPDYFDGSGVCLLEWPEILEDYLPNDRLDVYITGCGDGPRSICLDYPESLETIVKFSLEEMKGQ